MMFLLGIRSALKRIPWQVWAAIALAAALWLGVRWYDGRIDAAEKRGAQAEGQRIADKALKLKQQTDMLTSRIATVIREKNNVEVRYIDRTASDLQLRGPGAASARCASPAKPASGRVAPGGSGDVAVAVVPPDEGLAVLPWVGAVSFARVCDLNRAETLAWRDWEKQVREAWPKSD